MAEEPKSVYSSLKFIAIANFDTFYHLNRLAAEQSRLNPEIRCRYRNASEVVRAGLPLLQEQEAEYRAKLKALQEGRESGESAIRPCNCIF